MQRSLGSFTTTMFDSSSFTTFCRYRRRYGINRCYHPEKRGQPCGIVIHEQWEANGKPDKLSCKYAEQRL